ncbi:sulfatase-like hydrolase/transferase [Myxococcota bacterium]|nr:sulfatase-like hydrolase/transferase [Myxococcota bacterium]
MNKVIERLVSKFSGIAIGATVGGLLTGAFEGGFRGVSIPYTALLYGAIWAFAGLLAAVFVALIPFIADRIERSFFWGISFALVPSSLVLGRFIFWRDVFHETPGKGMLALALAATISLFIFTLLLVIDKMVARELPDRACKPAAFVAPLLVMVAFLVAVSVGDSASSLSDDSKAVKQLKGKGVILVLVDTLRADALGAYGAKNHRGEAVSPHFDKFASEGILYKKCNAQASWTRPAVASIITGRHVEGHVTMSKIARLPKELPTIASQLKKAGIKSGAVVTNYNLDESFGFSRGFEDFRYLEPARYLGAPPRANKLAAYNVYRVVKERFFGGQREAKHFYRSAPEVNHQGFEILDTIGNEPFFLWLHYMEPHDPYFDIDGPSYARVQMPHPPVSAAKAMLKAYNDDVKLWDDGFGELLAGLKARGLDDKVTVIVVADHGEEFGEHGGFYHGVTLYEEQLNVPLAIRGPGLTPAVISDLVRQIDLASTITALLGKEPAKSWEGRDIFGEAPVPSFSMASEDHEGNQLSSIRVGDQKLITANPDNPRGLAPEELYNLADDPLEKTPKDDSDLRLELKNELYKRAAKAKKGGAELHEKALDADAEAELRALGYME